MNRQKEGLLETIRYITKLFLNTSTTVWKNSHYQLTTCFRGYNGQCFKRRSIKYEIEKLLKMKKRQNWLRKFAQMFYELRSYKLRMYICTSLYIYFFLKEEPLPTYILLNKSEWSFGDLDSVELNRTVGCKFFNKCGLTNSL